LFFWGPALQPALRGVSSNQIASQCDIAETLNQGLLLNRKKHFDYSANLLDNERRSPAVYIFNSGFGVVKESAEIVFHNQPRQVTSRRGDAKTCDSLLMFGQVFQYRQVVNYLKY
jgi:hypothetical protein